MAKEKSHKLKRFVRSLEQYRGRHTELVSVYIPEGYDLTKIITQLQQEQGTAENIKDKNTRTNVIDSLEKMIRHLKLFKKNPENGLAVFSGNVSEREDKTVIEVFSIEPPRPLKMKLYRCDQTFLLDPLKEMMEHKETYGLVIVDRNEATIGILRGSVVTMSKHLTSGVPGKTRAGGQCSILGTLVQSSSGHITKIEDCKDYQILKSANFKTNSLIDSPIIDKWVAHKSKAFKIITKSPQLVNECSGDHVFFVLSPDGIIEKPAEELKKGSYLMMPEKIKIKGKKQNINSKKYYNSFVLTSKGRKILETNRKTNGFSQKQLSQKIGMTQTAISFYEIGKIDIGAKALKKLCDGLNIDYGKFIDQYTIQKHYRNTRVQLPTRVNEELAQFLGYLIGDGSIESDRITFSEQNKQVTLAYQNKFNKFFNLNSSYRFRESKNYHQLRFTSRPLVKLIKGEFPEIKLTLDSEVPLKIMESPPKIISSFLKGFFDAEGYTHNKHGVGITSNNKTIIGQVHLLLLRFGIISSFQEYDNRRNPYSNNPAFKLAISEKESLQKFKNDIGFTSKEKKGRLLKLINHKSDKSLVRQVNIPGSKVREIIEQAGYKLSQFPKVSDFFRDKKMMSKQAFKKSILKNIKDKKLYQQLNEIYNFEIIPVQIHKIEIKNKRTKMVDISVKNQSFISNGLIVHNSAARFARIRTEMTKEFFNRIAEILQQEFLEMKNLKGIIVGGPGPTKETFVHGHFINQQIRDKIIAVKDVTYGGRTGLEYLVEQSEDILSEQIIIKEKKLLNRFFTMLATKPEHTAYGLVNVKKAIEMGAIEVLLLSESLDDKLSEELEDQAEEMGSNVEIVSTDTSEGAQLRDLGGVAAILRFAIS